MNSILKIDYDKAATTLNCEVAAIRAIVAVESSDEGFLADGRPKILFERHIFRRRLLLNNISLVGLPKEIVNEKPGGYQGGIAEYTRLEQAKKIDFVSAHESCSWGMFQIMGFHWKRLRYTSLQDFLQAMSSSQHYHLDAFIRFIQTDEQLLQALRDLNWSEFARIYNGPHYKRNGYDKKMQEAYQKYYKV